MTDEYKSFRNVILGLLDCVIVEGHADMIACPCEREMCKYVWYDILRNLQRREERKNKKGQV